MNSNTFSNNVESRDMEVDEVNNSLPNLANLQVASSEGPIQNAQTFEQELLEFAAMVEDQPSTNETSSLINSGSSLLSVAPHSEPNMGSAVSSSGSVAPSLSSNEVTQGTRTQGTLSSPNRVVAAKKSNQHVPRPVSAGSIPSQRQVPQIPSNIPLREYLTRPASASSGCHSDISVTEPINPNELADHLFVEGPAQR